MDSGFIGGVYAMGPRVPMVKPRDRIGITTSALGFKVPSRVLSARSGQGAECTDPQLCQKPVGSTSMTIPIAIGVS